jgi:hypothetical protein
MTPSMLLADGIVVGCIFHAAASPVGTPWRWTLAFGHHEDSTPTHRLRADARGGDGGVREELVVGGFVREVQPCGRQPWPWWTAQF